MDVIDRIKKENNLFSYLIFGFVLLLFTVFFFNKLLLRNWNYVGDTLNSLGLFSYQFSGIVRGEYPLWNPLVRAGESSEIFQLVQLANPLSNFISLISSFFKIQDIVLIFSIYVYLNIIIYIIGIYRLVDCWTDDHQAALFASMLALATSTVFFYTYHVSFILITFTIPWFLYAATMYYRNQRFKYILILLLAYCVSLYSYEVVLDFSYLIILALTLLFFYRKYLKFDFIKKIPISHYIFTFMMISIMTLPAVFIYFDLNTKFLPISRISNLTISDNYELVFNEKFERISADVLFSPGFWSSLFNGLYVRNFHGLRQIVGPIVLPFMLIASFTKKRLSLTISVSSLMVISLANGLFPVNLLFLLPGINLIRNTHFLLQYVLFSLIVLAGLGFNYLRNDSLRTNKIVLFLTSSFLVFSAVEYLFIPHSKYNNIMIFLFLACSVGLILNIVLARKSFEKITFSITAFYVLIFFLALNTIPSLHGQTNNDPYISGLRTKKNYSQIFKSNRPNKIQKINQRYLKKIETEFGDDEYSSLATLKDNSFRMVGGNTGLSSFPVMKDYYLFASLPGSNGILKKKFFLFEGAYISKQPKDMIFFRKNPHLLESMINKNIAVVDDLKSSNKNLNLGKFDKELKGNKSKKHDFKIKILQYNANNIRLNFSSNYSGLLGYTDSWDDGWKVYVDGKLMPLRKVFHTFKGVEVDSGNHEIEFVYENNLNKALILMNMSFLICCLIFLIKRH